MRNARGLTLAIAVGLLPIATLPVSAQSAGTPPPQVAFWEVLGDPVLDRLMEQALSGSPELRAASARREGAGASRLGAALELGPVVRADAGYPERPLADCPTRTCTAPA
jgi:outer membrane protein TolC